MLQSIADPQAGRVKILSNIERVGNCWEWQAGRSHEYGCLKFEGRAERAHRVSYIAFVGPIPEGLVLDHLCRNRICVNPEHLEPVTVRENNLRGDSPGFQTKRAGVCKRGHARTPENVTRTGACKACEAERARKRWADVRREKGQR